MQQWTRCWLTSVRIGIEDGAYVGIPGGRGHARCECSFCPGPPVWLPPLAQLPLGHGELCVRRYRALFRLSRQPVLSGRDATTGAGATSGDKETLGAGSPWRASTGCVDVPYDPSDQGQLHHVFWRAVHLPHAGWAVLRQDET